ncbi:MAG: class I SAM-dependent methyltransferase [Mycobacterium sp.]|nr:class I SAM-dependent methyltransferase [Mycobacterium sp.]
MTDDPYSDEDLVQLYDLDNPATEDHAYYRTLAEHINAGKIVDLGCGTGLLTRALATPGRTVIGVDPSATMLAYARRQPGAEAVTWVDGDASVIPPAGDADLAISTGNAIMHISPVEYPSVLRALAAALRPGGTISFESRNPAAREWESWTREATYSERDTPVGHLREWLHVTENVGGRVVFESHNVFPDGSTKVYESVLYFRSADDIREGLEAAGFQEVSIEGGWHGEPVSDSSRIFVFRARKR